MLLHRKWNLPGPSGRISSELMLPEAFDEENDHCALVILMHGFLGAKYKTPIPFLSEMLLAQGYAVLRFDFDGYGESEGAQEDNTVPKMLEDARTVWEYAVRLPFVDRIVLLGHSQGGVVAGMLAGRLEKAGTPPSALILLAPASVLKDYAIRGKFFTVRCNPENPPEYINVYGFRIGREYILSAQGLPIGEEMSCYTGPVCLLHGTCDFIVPVSGSDRLARLFPNCEYHRIRGTGHIFLFRRPRVRRLIQEFLIFFLKADGVRPVSLLKRRAK